MFSSHAVVPQIALQNCLMALYHSLFCWSVMLARDWSRALPTNPTVRAGLFQAVASE